jgi:hypothetical protein
MLKNVDTLIHLPLLRPSAFYYSCVVSGLSTPVLNTYKTLRTSNLLLRRTNTRPNSIRARSNGCPQAPKTEFPIRYQGTLGTRAVGMVSGSRPSNACYYVIRLSSLTMLGAASRRHR